jgi:cytochrome c peroxidase
MRFEFALVKLLSLGALAALLILAGGVRLALRRQIQPRSIPEILQLPVGFPKPRIPADNPMSVAKTELGRYLFYDKRLSGNQTQSCGSCHQQALAFTDGSAHATGSTGDAHPRSSMSLVNVAYAGVLTWTNPEMRSLEKQVMIPLMGQEPVEMGMPNASELVKRLENDARYRELFAKAFPGEPVTIENATKAIAAFERTIISARSPYDRYYFGRDANAISDSAKRGEALFFTEGVAGCYRCHGGFNMSDTSESEDRPLAQVALHDTAVSDGPQKFKVPPLRNIAVTAPYMHDGSMRTLEEVIDHYAQGGRFSDNTYKDARMIRIPLTDQNKRDLIAFLNALTDDALLHDPRFSDPFAHAN